MFAKSIKTGQLIVAIAAAVSNPTSVFVGRAALSALSLLSDELSNRHPALIKLAGDIDRAFHRDLAKPAYDKPADLRLLLPQMLDASADRMEFAHHGLDAGRILDDLIDRLDAPDYRPEHIRAFRRLMAPILEQVCNDPRLKEALDPALTRIQMQRQQEQSSQIEIILARLGGIEQALETPASLANLAPGDLIALAHRFGAPPDADPATLIDFLTDKAREYADYRDQIDSLDDRVSAVADLKRDALSAAERLDFDAVEEILSQVTTTEATIFAETALARAQNALMRGRAEQAFTLMSAAADAFGAVDRAQPPRRRNHYASLLMAHAQRYGGPAFALAADMLDIATQQARAADQAELARVLQRNRGLALHNQARLSSGPDSAALLSEAITLLEASLIQIDPATEPEDYATAQLNLGSALNTAGGRTSGAGGITLLTRAIAAFTQALDHTDRNSDPLDWSRRQQNLGVAFKSLAERQAGDDAAASLLRSVTAFETALTATPPADQPEDWATIQLNLGSALTLQAESQSSALQSATLERAIAALNAALDVYTQPEHPVDWLLIQNNLGNALASQAVLGGAAEGFARAENAYLAMLAHCDESGQPMLWAMAHENLAYLHLDWAGHCDSEAGGAAAAGGAADGSNHLASALSHVDSALAHYDPEHASQDHANAMALRQQITERMHG
ncbi:hypothetical protein N4R57_08075 [Rhodobacteraceae bacterium D3-12]|nr:hypothetical protein N4R57_08075 [Rhodobacteraceae bacterium D3-12]